MEVDHLRRSPAALRLDRRPACPAVLLQDLDRRSDLLTSCEPGPLVVVDVSHLYAVDDVAGGYPVEEGPGRERREAANGRLLISPAR